MKNPKGQVFAILAAHNLTRPERLAVLSYITTREVGSLNDLSARELEQVASVLFSWDAAGHLDAQLAEILRSAAWSAPFTGPHVQHGDLVAVQLADGRVRTDRFDADSLRKQVGPSAPKWLREMIDAAEAFGAEAAYNTGRIDKGLTPIATIVTATTEIDALRAENSAMRTELDAVLNSEIGKVAAHNDALFRENHRLRAENRALRDWQFQVADALGLMECIEGVGNAVIVQIPEQAAEIAKHYTDTALQHEQNCPVFCDGCEHYELPHSCKDCHGSGCGPGTALGTFDPCRACDGDGRDHAFAYVNMPDLQHEMSALRDELETLQHSDIGELAARADELWAENQRLKADVRRLS